MDTTFSGRFNLDRYLAVEHLQALEEFADEEHAYEDGRPGGPGMPDGYYCQWRPSDDGMGIEWDGVEKFYNYVEWLEYLMAHFLRPWVYTLSGSVEWASSIYEPAQGAINVKKNTVAVVIGLPPK